MTGLLNKLKVKRQDIYDQILAKVLAKYLTKKKIIIVEQNQINKIK